MILILAVVVGLVLSMYYYNQLNAIKKEGGAVVKYSELIEHLISFDPNYKVPKITNTHVLIETVTKYGKTSFSIRHRINSVIIDWFNDNSSGSPDKSRWKFNNQINQEVMASRVMRDVILIRSARTNANRLVEIANQNKKAFIISTIDDLLFIEIHKIAKEYNKNTSLYIREELDEDDIFLASRNLLVNSTLILYLMDIGQPPSPTQIEILIDEAAQRARNKYLK